ncbi:MAG TPA: hypothetical protein DEG64_10880, partial [Marinobacter adhaerens]|nr:hypothetical protein [Marinobacter adhaerens]
QKPAGLTARRFFYTLENPFTSKFCSPPLNWFNLLIILKAYPMSVAIEKSVQDPLFRRCKAVRAGAKWGSA